MADNIAAKEQAEAPEGMITGLISEQVTSRPMIYNRKIQGHTELADGPIYQEARKRGKRMIRDLHKPPEGEEEGDENSDIEAELERLEGRREIEKFVHGVRNGEIVGGPANGRRMRHATREGNRPSFWTYLKRNGCRGYQKQGEEEIIHHVLSGR
eukprot:6200488-Pleurochrysis_carterae.AAC.1